MRRLAVSALTLCLAVAGAACDMRNGGAGGKAATTATSGDTAAGVHTVPLHVVKQGEATLALIPVTIAGQGPYPFALDTGASRSVVDRPVAQRLGLRTTGTAPVTGVAGRTQALSVHVNSWKIGQVALDARTISAIDLPEPQRGSGIQGLLGSDVLSGFGQVTVDYEAEQLRLGKPAK